MGKMGEFTILRKKIRRAKEETDRALGGLQEVRLQLQSAWNCKTIEETRSLLRQIKKKKYKLERTINANLKKFLREFGNVLDGEGPGGVSEEGRPPQG